MVIVTKADLREYLQADRNAQHISDNFIVRRMNRIYKLKTLLRKCEYHANNKDKNLWHKIAYLIQYMRFRCIERSCCSEIGLNVFGKGLVIWHPERIIINPNARVGEHCSISSGVVIAQAHDKSPVIGNDVELMIDSAVLGGIVVADHVRIGAKALVLKDIDEPNTTWGGVPAKKLNNRGTIETPVRA